MQDRSKYILLNRQSSFKQYFPRKVYKFIMLIQLNKDPLFVVTQSPIKAIKEKQLQRKKLMRERRINPPPRRKDAQVEIVDPLPLELQNYRTETSFKSSVETSKASESLKKYVIEQERNLRCLRLQKISFAEKPSTSRLKSLTLNLTQIEDQQRNGKQIHIPRIEDLFKNQSKQILVYENSTLRDRLGKMIHVLDQGISKFKSLHFSHTRPDDPPSQSRPGYLVSEEDYEIDKIIEKKLMRSRDLQDRLYKQKKEMAGRPPGEASKSAAPSNMSYFLREVEKPKRKEGLRGVRTYSYQHGSKNIKLTSASILLFEMNKLNNQKQKKQYQLTGLLKNSFQNRDSILHQKQIFYQSQNPFNDLSPSKQFQLRKVMNKKLNHRLQISKQQVNKFINYLYEVKNYHVILNETILQILREVRQTLLRGKVMKISDFQFILSTKDPEDLKNYPNQLIVKTLTEMMI